MQRNRSWVLRRLHGGRGGIGRAAKISIAENADLFTAIFLAGSRVFIVSQRVMVNTMFSNLTTLRGSCRAARCLLLFVY